MFKIGEFSKMSNCSIRALHHYEKQGLLTPKFIDPNTNYRYYSASQLNETNTIKSFQEIGMSLAMIKEIMKEPNPKMIAKYCAIKKQELIEEISQLSQRQYLLDNLSKNLIDGTRTYKYHVGIKKVPERNVMSLRTKIASYEEEYSLWNRLYKQSQKQHVKLANPMFGMTIYHDKEYLETDIDIEVQSDVVGDYANENGICYVTTPSFTMASVIFSGDFNQMPDVTRALATWIENSEYKMNGIMVNIPIVSPGMDENPDNWITEAGFIINKKER